MGSTSTIPSFDLSRFLSASQDEDVRRNESKKLANALHLHGVVGLTGHGISLNRLREAFDMSKRLFALSHEDKMKAPHPEGMVPHRGYSCPGMEKAFSKEELMADEEVRKAAKKILDYKEHYEIGSEENKYHYNIWLPEEVLPGFRKFETDLYWELREVASNLFDALLMGLESDEEAARNFKANSTGHRDMLRLLHYPPVEEEKVDRAFLTRVSAHTDFSTFTLLFQDSQSGLEYEDLNCPDTFMPAPPEPGKLYLNAADMLEIFSNGYYPSSRHRVQVPPRDPAKDQVEGRYSLAYFANVSADTLVVPQKTGRPGQMPEGNFTAKTYLQHLAFRTKGQFQGGGLGDDETPNGDAST